MINIYYTTYLQLLDFGTGHPLTGDRYVRFVNYVKEKGKNCFEIIENYEKISRDKLAAVHSEEYIDYVKRKSEKGGYLSLDTPVNKKIYEGTLYALQSSIIACDGIKDERHVISFGGFHHAGISYGGGFCLFNDVSVCAKYLQKIGYKKVAIIDTDAHGGNGTMDIFYDDPSVLFISFHQDPRTLYPGTGFPHQIGSGEGKGYTANITLPPGATIDFYKIGFERIVEPLISEYLPDVIIRNGGSDPYYMDTLCSLGLLINDFVKLGEMVKNCVGELPFLELFASGYNDDVLPQCWFNLACGTTGCKKYENIEEKIFWSVPDIKKWEKNVIDYLVNSLKEWWKM